MLPCPFWKTEKRKEMAKLYHPLRWWVLMTLDSELIINPFFFFLFFFLWWLFYLWSFNMKFVQHVGMEKIKSNIKPNKVIRAGECACGSVYLPGVVLICTWIFVYLCQSSWPLNWKCFLAHNQLLWSIIFNVFIHLFWPDSDTLTYSEQHTQTGQNIVLLISCVFKKIFFACFDK